MTQAAADGRPISTHPEAFVSPRTEATLKEILFPSDLSEASDGAFEHARFLAERFQARLTLFHAVERPESRGPRLPTPIEHERWRRAEKGVREFLAHRADRLSVAHELAVERAQSSASALLSFIEATQPDLTVMATHGRVGLAHLLLGSVTETVLQHSRRPVLCVREPDHGIALPYRRVLVPTDLSQASRRAFPMAALFARQFGAEVIAIHVARPPHISSLSGVPDLVEASVATEEWVAAFLQPEFQGLRVTARVEEGTPWAGIVATARVEKADMVVMSTQGHDSLTDRVMGSQTERVVRQAPCPVLVTW